MRISRWNKAFPALIWRYSQATVFDCRKDAIPASRSPAHGLLEEGPKWKTHKIIFALSLQSRNMKAPNIHFGVPCGMDECVLKVVCSRYSVPSYQFGSVFQLKVQAAHQTSNQPYNILPPTTRPATLVGVQGLCHGPCHDPGRGPGKTKNGLSWRGTKQEIVRPSNRKDYRLSWLKLLDQLCNKNVRKRTQLASPLGKKVRKRIFPSTKSERFMGCFHRRLHHNITYQNEPWKIIHTSTPKTSLRTSENRPIGRPEGRSEKLSSDSHVDLTYTSQVVG